MTPRADDRTGRHDRVGVVSTALALLDEVGLPDLSMRRLATRLGIQPSALYWHFESKQELLGAVAERILARIPTPHVSEPATDAEIVTVARGVRDALLAYRDGAEVVLSSYALGFGVDRAEDAIHDVLLSRTGPFARVAARTLLQFIVGHALLLQQRLHGASHGAIRDGSHDGLTDPVSAGFDAGILLFLTGLDAAETIPRYDAVDTSE